MAGEELEALLIDARVAVAGVRRAGDEGPERPEADALGGADAQWIDGVAEEQERRDPRRSPFVPVVVHHRGAVHRDRVVFVAVLHLKAAIDLRRDMQDRRGLLQDGFGIFHF